MGEKDEKKSSDVREKIMSYIDIGVAASQKGLKSAGKALSDFGDKSVQRIELTKLKAKEDRAFVKLGKAVYEKLSSKTASVEASDEDLTEILAAIAQLEKDIKKLNGNAKPAAEKAAKTIDAFSKYLRINTDALSKREPVSILEEVKHAKTYSDIEMVRFDNVNVIFNIEDQDFKLPVLTLEPIVENAIKYGVRAKEKGIVEVRTFKEGNKHILIVKDNGIGFNVNEIKNDGRNHVGIENVKKRVENMVHGTFEIESEVGAGTTVTITVLEE